MKEEMWHLCEEETVAVHVTGCVLCCCTGKGVIKIVEEKVYEWSQAQQGKNSRLMFNFDDVLGASLSPYWQVCLFFFSLSLTFCLPFPQLPLKPSWTWDLPTDASESSSHSSQGGKRAPRTPPTRQTGGRWLTGVTRSTKGCTPAWGEGGGGTREHLLW